MINVCPAPELMRGELTTIISNYEQLRNLVQKFITPDCACVVHAGHFILLRDRATGKIVPSLQSMMQQFGFPQDLCHDIGVFPLATWRLGLRLVRDTAAKSHSMFVIVNDWQWLKGYVEERKGFYGNCPALPEEYREAMAREGVPESVLFVSRKGSTHGPYFSEVELRSRFRRSARKLKRHITAGDLEYIVEQTGVFCGGANCTAEVAQLMQDITARVGGGAVRFINLYPLTCKGHVNQGTRMGLKLFELTDMRVLNIGFPNLWLENDADLFAHVSVDCIDKTTAVSSAGF